MPACITLDLAEVQDNDSRYDPYIVTCKACVCSQRERPDDIVILPPVGNKAGIFCILEHKRISDVCDQYLTRGKHTSETQYESLRSAISKAIQIQGWRVEQISFITGVRSVNNQDLSKNLQFFNVPEASIHSIYSKLVLRVFDV